MLGQGIEQLYVFVVFVVLGIALCSAYLFGLGLFRSKLFGTIFDCIWGAVSLWLVWRVNLDVNNGQCRLFVFIAIVVGATLAYVSCKSMLDKASGLLYNLFTTKLVDVSDGSNLLQKNNLDTVRDGDIGATDTRLHAVGVTDATVGAKQPRRRFARKDSTGDGRHRRQKPAARRQRIIRLRDKVGREER